MSDLIDRDIAIATIKAEYTDEWCNKDEVIDLLNDLPAAELTCDGCKYNVGGMFYQPCGECMRSANDNWTAEDDRC